MTKIYIYCLFDEKGVFHGVYSSLKAVHRDALKIANAGPYSVQMETEGQIQTPSLTSLRNVFKGRYDIMVLYRNGAYYSKIIKTKLQE